MQSMPYDERNEDSGKFEASYSDNEFIDAVESIEPTGPPTTTDIADAVGCKYRTAHKRLNDLADSGRLDREKIGNTIVWHTKQIETGTESDSDVTPSDADIFAFADNGEHATVWEVDRLSETLVRVNYYRCEAGLSDHDGEETFSVDADKTTEEFARELADADPEEAVRIAREYWSE